MAAVTPDKFDAVLFDLDGVITDTAKMHASAWKQAFDEFLKKHADGESYKPFDKQSDIYLKAAEMLGVDAGRAVVVEDALAGVEAGHRGGFGLVIGMDRKHDADALRENGADTVVSDLQEMRSA